MKIQTRFLKLISTILLLPFLILFINVGCQKELAIDIKTNDKRLIVNGEFTSDTMVHMVKLYCSGSLVTGKTQSVLSGAKVFITDKIDTFYYNENTNFPGTYETSKPCFGIDGLTYYVSISNIDIDNDGVMDNFNAQTTMPNRLIMDSLSVIRGLHPADKIMGINCIAYFKIPYNGPEFFYKYLSIGNKHSYKTLTDRLGTGELSLFSAEFMLPKVNTVSTFINRSAYLQATNNVLSGDTIVFHTINLNIAQSEFLKAFDNNTDGNAFKDNIYDELKVPSNLPTNIEPSSKAAGYFFIYSTSRISRVFEE